MSLEETIYIPDYDINKPDDQQILNVVKHILVRCIDMKILHGLKPVVEMSPSFIINSRSTIPLYDHPFVQKFGILPRINQKIQTTIEVEKNTSVADVIIDIPIPYTDGPHGKPIYHDNAIKGTMGIEWWETKIRPYITGIVLYLVGLSFSITYYSDQDDEELAKRGWYTVLPSLKDESDDSAYYDPIELATAAWTNAEKIADRLNFVTDYWGELSTIIYANLAYLYTDDSKYALKIMKSLNYNPIKPFKGFLSVLDEKFKVDQEVTKTIIDKYGDLKINRDMLNIVDNNFVVYSDNYAQTINAKHVYYGQLKYRPNGIIGKSATNQFDISHRFQSGTIYSGRNKNTDSTNTESHEIQHAYDSFLTEFNKIYVIPPYTETKGHHILNFEEFVPEKEYKEGDQIRVEFPNEGFVTIANESVPIIRFVEINTTRTFTDKNELITVTSDGVDSKFIYPDERTLVLEVRANLYMLDVEQLSLVNLFYKLIRSYVQKTNIGERMSIFSKIPASVRYRRIWEVCVQWYNEIYSTYTDSLPSISTDSTKWSTDTQKYW